ncbi:DUF4430 domain-containing protein [Cohnella suwonensis]|uniref:DUF4430 domain-containing protein n=1 Tax=Cohnella suwonensis TaxID=696072 RepID=A0ABW0LYN3_9BACL
MGNIISRLRSAAAGLILTLVVLVVIAGCSADGNGGTASASSAIQTEAPTPSAEPSAPAPSSSATATATMGGSSAEASPSGEVSPAPSPSASANPSNPSPSPKPGQDERPSDAAPATEAITISIEGNAEWGTILKAESVILSKGETPASVLKRAAKAHRLAFGIRGSGAMTYVEGIDGLFEFDDGPTSGWKYRVNGIVADIGAGAYKLEAGDRLEWYYVSEDAEAQEGKESTP